MGDKQKELNAALFDHTRELRLGLGRLNTLADAAAALGLTEMLKTIASVGDRLEASVQKLHDAHAAAVTERMNEGDRSVRQIAEAASLLLHKGE